MPPVNPPPTVGRIILIMGVAGSGKTTIGQQLAAGLGWPYFEADDFHPAANREKMAAGQPLDDADRAPWLAAIRRQMDACRAAGQSAVFTCSALKEQYRTVLLDGAETATLVYLAGDYTTLQRRLEERTGHYMKASLLPSQLATLEVPAQALTIDIRLDPAAIVAAIRQHAGV
jgi:gluconokinase